MTTKTKLTSIQSWNDLIETYFHRRIKIEERKDRQWIYQLIAEFGLQTEKIVPLPGKDLDKNELGKALEITGTPFWISATPLPGENGINRLTKLNLKSLNDGWDFIQTISQLEKYKVLVIQYPTNTKFKGTALVSQSHHGIIEFVQGDHHFDLTGGAGLHNPTLFEHGVIKHYSNDVPKKIQDELVSLIAKIPGHFEFQYAKLNSKLCLSFFDYNDELAYEDIDGIFSDLQKELAKPQTNLKNVLCQGMTACPGVARGIAGKDILVVSQTTPDMTPFMAKAKAIVTDLGGVTSHAAIVCRELKIPCIVGTKNATKVLKIGLKILVNADLGIVQIL